MLQDYGIEWDRVLLTTLGVANKRVYELRMQTAQVCVCVCMCVCVCVCVCVCAREDDRDGKGKKSGKGQKPLIWHKCESLGDVEGGEVALNSSHPVALPQKVGMG